MVCWYPLPSITYFIRRKVKRARCTYLLVAAPFSRSGISCARVPVRACFFAPGQYVAGFACGLLSAPAPPTDSSMISDISFSRFPICLEDTAPAAPRRSLFLFSFLFVFFFVIFFVFVFTSVDRSNWRAPRKDSRHPSPSASSSKKQRERSRRILGPKEGTFFPVPGRNPTVSTMVEEGVIPRVIAG